MEKLESIIFYSIDKAIRTYRQYAQNQLKQQGFEMTIDQWIVLKCILENPEITQSEIAAKVFKDNASVTRIISLLIKARHLSKRTMRSNRRRVVLTITPQGIETLKGMEQIVFQNRATALKGISEQEIEVVKNVMQKITANCE
ncbi:MAG: MarR family winged helix-turn-helix transcriptional regulator [Bacteroidota bacterium]